VFQVLDITASALTAQRVRMEVAAENIANAESTRGGPGGGPYRRKQVVLAAGEGLDYASPVGGGPPAANGAAGVTVLGIEEDQSPLPQVYDPSHPDANADGYVSYPNVYVPIEMADMLAASRAYEAAAAAMKAASEGNTLTLDLLR